MKRALALFLCLTLFLGMTACEVAGNWSEISETTKELDVSVTIDGISYNEKEYRYYLDVSITNETDKIIGGSTLSTYFNGYYVNTYGSIDTGANSTVKKQLTIDRKWLTYYYNLCNLKEVDNVDLTLEIYERETRNNKKTITASADIEKIQFDENRLLDSNFKADIEAKVYEDEKCSLTLLTYYKDYLSKPAAFFLLENKYISDKIYMDYASEETITAEINGKEVSCGTDILLPDKDGISKEGKAIVPVEIGIKSAGISLSEIKSMKIDFVIENKDTMNSIKYAEISVNNQVQRKIRPSFGIIDDDGKKAVYTKMYPWAVANNVPFTTAIITQNLDKDPNNSWCSSNEVREMYNSGFVRVGSHTRTHTRIDKLDPSQYETEFGQSKKDIEKIGIPCDLLLYPMGLVTDEAIKSIQKYYKYGANASGDVRDIAKIDRINYPTISNYHLKRLSIGSAISKEYMNKVKEQIDDTIANNGMLIFMTHIGSAGGATGGATADADLKTYTEIVNYIRGKGYDIEHIADILERFYNG